MNPLVLDSRSAGLEGARVALATTPRRPLPAWAALLCAGLMTSAALGTAAVVVLGGWEPARVEAGPVRAALSLR